ncbi:capsid protein [Red clover powdery mildew-associated totivirus 7]|uniref:Capsid protein n=1 Tax=Red clover powdery mildew-associated totivirus 7 TaxID=1714368 RepID=A0A0S3Q2A2_9VIRU|nr:capsid protein [Red clover powdery mildew-associated totivirus 7]BAT62489.1 capsid protein [Red clover powdery mildew-associated totivirus 7]
MNTFSEYINAFASIDALPAGEFALRTKLRLDCSGLGKPEKKIGDTDEARVTGDGHVIGDTTLPSGETYQARRETAVLSKATVYGPQAVVRLSGTMNSLSGLAVGALTDSGEINYAWLRSEFRLVNPSVDLKEARTNQLLTAWLERGIYDNAIPLLVKLLQKLRIAQIYELSDYSNEVFRFGSWFARTHYTKRDAALATAISNYMRNVNTAQRIGVCLTDLHENEWVDKVGEWLDSQPPPFMEGDNGEKIDNPKCGASPLELPMAVMTCHTYDDGHSSSGSTFMSESGFVNGRFKVPVYMNKIRCTETVVKNVNYYECNDDAAVKRLVGTEHHINVSGLTAKELSLLNFCLSDNVRRTPLLVDQVIDFKLREGSVALYNAVEMQDFEEARFSAKEMLVLTQKLVRNHNWYEDLRSAILFQRYWLAQPSTETVESHWWVNMQRVANLPKLGLMRAAIPQLVSTVGAQISAEGLNSMQIIGKMDLSEFVNSVFLNTVWYWGEYLAIYSARNNEHLVNKMRSAIVDNVREEDRHVVLPSAVLGKSVPRSACKLVFVAIAGGVRSQGSRVTAFGKIDIPNLDERGYSVNGTDVCANCVVEPGCLGLVTGLAGTLIRNTPYSSAFSVNSSALVRAWKGVRVSYNWHDLWALCVVARWQGYDVVYRTSVSSVRRYRSYAANMVGIAAPPVKMSEATGVGRFVVDGVLERGNVFGSDIASQHSMLRSFTWHRSQSVVLAEPKINAFEALAEEVIHIPIEHYITVNPGATNYVGYILADYDHDTSDFRVEEMRTAIPFATDSNNLGLRETVLEEAEPDVE